MSTFTLRPESNDPRLWIDGNKTGWVNFQRLRCNSCGDSLPVAKVFAEGGLVRHAEERHITGAVK